MSERTNWKVSLDGFQVWWAEERAAAAERREREERRRRREREILAEMKAQLRRLEELQIPDKLANIKAQLDYIGVWIAEQEASKVW